MSLHVLTPGLAASLQDFGRFGYLDRGLPPSGALDTEALAAANALCGNPLTMAAIEIAGLGPRLEIRSERVRIALAGNIRPKIDGQAVAPWRSHVLHCGQVLETGAVSAGHVAYLAAEGGFDLPPILDSLSCYVRGGLGTKLESGLDLPLLLPRPASRTDLLLPSPDFTAPDCLRVIPGPQEDAFSKEARQLFLSSDWRVSAQADRMGLRLDGPKLNFRTGPDIPPEGIVKGCIQVPGDGQPILLLADHQTTGGYAKIAAVISADLAGAGRLPPGSRIRFKAVTWRHARQALTERRAALNNLLETIRPAGEIDPLALMDANLISGAVDALDGDGNP